MFKKLYYGANIAPACAYCLHGSTAADPKMILCKHKGVVSPYYCCRKFSYDPLMRVPRRQVLPELDPPGFYAGRLRRRKHGPPEARSPQESVA